MQARLLSTFVVPAIAWASLAHAQSPNQSPNPQPGQPSATVEQAVARAIADALPALRYPWGLDWSAFGVRGGRDVFWHLTGPAPYSSVPLPEGVHRRTGWFNVRGRSGSVDVCGDAERIASLTFSVSELWLGQADLIEELARRNVRATLAETRTADLSDADPRGDVGDYYREIVLARPAHQRWRLDRADHEPAILTADYVCSPPGTRSAVQCNMVWRIVFRPDEAEDRADCPLPHWRNG